MTTDSSSSAAERAQHAASTAGEQGQHVAGLADRVQGAARHLDGREPSDLVARARLRKAHPELPHTHQSLKEDASWARAQKS